MTEEYKTWKLLTTFYVWYWSQEIHQKSEQAIICTLKICHIKQLDYRKAERQLPLQDVAEWKMKPDLRITLGSVVLVLKWNVSIARFPFHCEGWVPSFPWCWNGGFIDYQFQGLWYPSTGLMFGRKWCGNILHCVLLVNLQTHNPIQGIIFLELIN